MENVILSPISKDELVLEILSGLETILKQSRKNELDSKEYLTSKETRDLLKISNVTLWNWSKSGILKSLKIGSRLRYKKSEVLSALHNIETKR